MLLVPIILLLLCSYFETRHFNGGTIRWEPVDSYDTTSPVTITIIQSYNWAYPTITCSNNVPITTFGRSTQNANLTCVTDCSTDGGYSAAPINILTDCQSVSASLGMLNSQRGKNVSLTSGAHFYLANQGSAWVSLNDPPRSGLEWSIVTLIDLRLRPDGFINTPPVASVVSPQYAFVNQTMQINIPVSDANPADDVRCRWATFTSGYRRRRRDMETTFDASSYFDQEKTSGHERNKRAACLGVCWQSCSCTDPACVGTTCTGATCASLLLCPTTTAAPTTIPPTTTTAAVTTTVDTPGTLRSTSTYPRRQAIDECGDICYPGSLPAGTTLSGCTISFTGLRANVWYGVAIQVIGMRVKFILLPYVRFCIRRWKILSIVLVPHR